VGDILNLQQMTEELIGESTVSAVAPTSTVEALNREMVETSALKGDTHLGTTEAEAAAEVEAAAAKQAPKEEETDRSPHEPVKVPATVDSTHSQPHRATASESHTPPPIRSETPLAAVTASLSTPEQARDHLNDFLKKPAVTLQKDKLRTLLNDYDSLKDKVSKLKSLLGRSAKAQRETKVDLDATQKRLDQALKEIERLNTKIDKLASRLTHLELLADFETNFDRALLSVGQNNPQHPYNQQPGGEDTAPPSLGSLIADKEESAIVDNLLMQELNESKQRIDKLESLYAGLTQRSSMLESELKEKKRERDDLANQVSRLELEKRMAVMEAEHAMKAMQEKAASLAEMQLEIDLVTKASVSANARTAQGEELIKNVKTDKQHVQQLEATVQALQEWALASTEAKILAQERVRLLENQLRSLQTTQRGGSVDAMSNTERIILKKSASLVVGAGDIGFRVVSLDEEMVRSVRLSDRVFLRWKFDLTQEDATIQFSILKSICDSIPKMKNGDCLLKERLVKGGAAGETENAFAIQGSCTLCWSNLQSWIRPKTVKYTVEAVVVSD